MHRVKLIFTVQTNLVVIPLQGVRNATICGDTAGSNDLVLLANLLVRVLRGLARKLVLLRILLLLLIVALHLLLLLLNLKHMYFSS